MSQRRNQQPTSYSIKEIKKIQSIDINFDKENDIFQSNININ